MIQIKYPPPPIPTLHTWTFHPCSLVTKDKESPVLRDIWSSGFQSCPLVTLQGEAQHSGDMKNTRSKETFILASKTSDGISTSSAPPFSHPYVATMMCSGLSGWLATLASQGIILANGRWGWAGLLYQPFLQWSTSLSAFSHFFLTSSCQ